MVVTVHLHCIDFSMKFAVYRLPTARLSLMPVSVPIPTVHLLERDGNPHGVCMQ